MLYNEDMKKLLKGLLTLILLAGILYLIQDLFFRSETVVEPEPFAEVLPEDGSYTSAEDVALYLVTYGRLPSNYVSKEEARQMGWIASKGNLWDVCDQCSIGGDRFGNREGSLPEKTGRKYYECDIGYEGGTRNGKRIIYSDDGLIYYTDDHYSSFTLLYGEP